MMSPMTRIGKCVVLLLTVGLLAACGSSDRASPKEPACGGTTSAVLGIHHVPTLTRERYEAVVHRLTNGHDRLQSLSDGGVEGLLAHVAGEGDDGFWVVDVWSSQEAVDRFSQRVRPIARAVGIEQPMKTYRIHTVLPCGGGG